jgi:hypothetical protein
MAGPTKCELRWTEIRESFENHHDALLVAHPDAQEEIRLIRNALIKIYQLVRNSPQFNGDCPRWKKLTDKAEADIEVLCRHLNGKALFAVLLRLYEAVHREMTETLQQGDTGARE